MDQLINKERNDLQHLCYKILMSYQSAAMLFLDPSGEMQSISSFIAQLGYAGITITVSDRVLHLFITPEEEPEIPTHGRTLQII